MKILLNEPLTSNDCTFLRALYVAALPDQDTLDFIKVTKAEIHGCGFILKLLDGESGSVKSIVLIDEVRSFIEQEGTSLVLIGEKFLA